MRPLHLLPPDDPTHVILATCTCNPDIHFLGDHISVIVHKKKLEISGRKFFEDNTDWVNITPGPEEFKQTNENY